MELIGVKSVITVWQVSILELSEAWLEIPTLSEESTTGGVKTDWIEKLKADESWLVVSPVTVTKILFIGKPMTRNEHERVLAVLVTAEQLGVVVTVLVLYTSLFQLRGNSRTTFPVDEMGFLGDNDTTILDRVNIVAL